MKVKDLRVLIENVDAEMEVVLHGAPANANIEARTLGEHPIQGLVVASPVEYPRYLNSEGRFYEYAQREGVIRVRLADCLVIGP
jgi:hypothetical protein